MSVGQSNVVRFLERARRLTVTPSALHPRRLPLFFGEPGRVFRAMPPGSGPVMDIEFVTQPAQIPSLVHIRTTSSPGRRQRPGPTSIISTKNTLTLKTYQAPIEHQ